MMTSGSNLSAPRACAHAGPGSANQVLLPWVDRLARHLIRTRDLSLVAELPADERDVVLDLAAKWAPSYPDSRQLSVTGQERCRTCGGYDSAPHGARCQGHLSQTTRASTEPIEASAGIGR
jgi:hypothetical protein